MPLAALSVYSSSAGLDKWTFSTVRCWGETPVGTWLLIITDKGESSRFVLTMHVPYKRSVHNKTNKMTVGLVMIQILYVN